MVETRAGYEIDRVGPFEIACVPAFSDNYHWLVKADEEVAVVDPGDGAACLAAADALGWTITHILVTHWHPDHTGGNVAVKEATGAPVIGPAPEAEKIPGIDTALGEGDTLDFGGRTVRIFHVPGHTLGHIAYVFENPALAFVGDTLFAMGCGRLFEGSAEQMHESLTRLSKLDPDTMVYCAHEYTEANGAFAITAEPEHAPTAERYEEVKAARATNRRTVPTTIARERETNPFMRAEDAFMLAQRRAAKDAF